MSEYSRIFDGWLTRYKLNRLLNKYELENRLELDEAITTPSIDKGVTKLNGSFAEYVDRYFFWRGWAAMSCVVPAAICLYFALQMGLLIYTPIDGELPSGELFFAGWIVTVLIGLLIIGLCVFAIKKDFFCYTHYPIRFNRKNRKVYIFQHNGPGGVIDIDWEKSYWIVGKIRDGWHSSYDLRCHILDNDGLIRHTFSVGGESSYRAEILQHWEMIRRYMEESPAALPFPPLHLYTCTEPTLWNCFLIQVGAVSGLDGLKSLPFLIFGSIWAFFRWISQKTCRTPRWPAEVEAVCQIAEDDPYRLPEPRQTAERDGLTEEEFLQEIDYIRSAKEAALAYEQANPVPSGP